jgi:3-deoxy-D-manno-octulosonic-acid transferase
LNASRRRRTLRADVHLPYLLGAYVLFVVLLPLLLLHPKLKDGWRQRLGLYPGPIAPGGQGPRIWFHGASAGDLSALSPMIHTLRARMPGATLVVSCMTNSGAAMARDRLGDVDAVVFQPWDLPGATRRAVAAIRPDLLVLEYTEIWPSLIHAAHRAGARIVLTNGRFGEKNLGRYRLLFALSGRPLEKLSRLLMRTEEEAERARRLGAPTERVQVTGNTKFDALLLGGGTDPSALAEALGLSGDEPVLVAGSTHEGEEALVLEVYARLRARHPALRLILVPRYLERVERVEAAVSRAGFVPHRRSGKGSPEKSEGVPVAILDTIGELVTCYRLATVVFIGGSFTDRGGQNILEPAAEGRPVIFGPNMQNFRDAVQVLVGRGGIQVGDADQLHRVVLDLLDRPEKLAELGALAKRTVHRVRGASDRNVAVMAELLGAEPSVESAAIPSEGA